MITTSTATEKAVEDAFQDLDDAREVRWAAERAVERTAINGSAQNRMTTETNYSDAVRAYARSLNAHADAYRAHRATLTD